MCRRRDFKAFALNVSGFSGFVSGAAERRRGEDRGVEQCQKRADAAQSPRKCELYAVGDTVVYAHGRPPMPPLPWIRRDAATEKPFASKDMPLMRDQAKAQARERLCAGPKDQGDRDRSGRQLLLSTPASMSAEEAVRRALETCGAIAGVACMIVALDDNLRRSGSDHLEGHRLLPGRRQCSISPRSARRRRPPACRCLERLECGRGRRGRPARTGAEGGDRTGRGQRRARRLRQARQRLPCHRDRPVRGRTELERDRTDLLQFGSLASGRNSPRGAECRGVSRLLDRQLVASSMDNAR